MTITAQTDLPTLLKAIRNKLTQDEVFAEKLVYFGLEPDKNDIPPSDAFCVITPLDQVVRQNIVAGGGNDTLWFDGEFLLTVHNRLALDEKNRDSVFLNDRNLGVLTTQKLIVSS